MKAAWNVLIVVAVVVVLTGGLAIAGPGFGRGGRGRGMGMGFGPQGRGPAAGEVGPTALGQGGGLGRAIRRLDLTDEQLGKVRDVLRQARTDGAAGADAVREARTALHDVVTAGASETRIREAAVALGEAIGNQAAHRARTLTAVKEVLTDEQRETLDQLMAQRPLAPGSGRGQGFGGFGRGRGAGPGQLGAARPGRGGPPADRGPLPLEEMFKAADANQDGTLTMDELQAFRDARQGARRP